MSRPKPKSSGLGNHPLTPPAEQTTKSTARKYRHKVTFYQDQKDTARVRGALRARMPDPDAPTTLSEFIHRAVMAEVQRLETEHNDGNPFPAVDAGIMARGRPVGEVTPDA